MMSRSERLAKEAIFDRAFRTPGTDSGGTIVIERDYVRVLGITDIP